jgi:translocation protein SEC72
MEDTFTQLPILFSPTTKLVTATSPSAGLDGELSALNSLHRALTSPSSGLDANSAPPPPTAVKPTRSAQVAKARDSGNAAQRSGKHADALRLYTLAIDIAAARPAWEPAALARDELCALYSNRAQAHMGLSRWAEGAVDAQCSVELKRAGNAKAWWRRGKCLVEMGRWEEAAEWVARGIEFEGREADLVELERVIRERRVKG